MTWPIVRVGDIAQQIRGVTFSKSEAFTMQKVGLLPVLTATNVTEDGLKLASILFVSESKVSDAQRLRENDVLITASSGSLSVVGRSVRVPTGIEAGFGAFCKVLRPSAAVHPGFFAHYFRTSSYRAKVSRLAAGANINNLRGEDLDGLLIGLPPLPEQRRIAEILDRADELRTKRRQALALLDELITSTFEHAFGASKFPWITLAEVCSRITDGTHQSPQWSASGIPFLFVSNIVGGSIDFSTDKYVSIQTYEALTKYAPIEVGDVLYSAVGSYGVPALVEKNQKFVFQRHIAHLKPLRKTVDPQFLASALGAKDAKRQADRVARGAAQKTVTLGELSKIRIPSVPLEKQQKFSTQIRKLHTVRQLQAQSLEQLNELFASLQSRAFSSKL
jgi:type I restriction enzyme S subunit